jgi:hypothetical protein
MIKAMTNNQKIPWSRLAVESIAIVGSILVAFAIDAWWEDRQERRDERSYLTSLRQEFVSGLDSVSQSESVHKEILDANVDLINQIQAETRASVESLHYMFSLLSRPTGLRLPRAVFDDLISSGGTQLIRSDDLRIALALYGRTLVRFQIGNDAAWATWEQRIQPYLEGRIPRIDRLMVGSFGRMLRQSGREPPFALSRHQADFEGVLADPVFEDMIAERWLRIEDRLGNIRELQNLMEEIVGMIESELGLEGA